MRDEQHRPVVAGERSLETWRGLHPFREDELRALWRPMRRTIQYCAVRGVIVPVSAAALQMFLMTSIWSMIFWVMMTNQFHKWAHCEPNEVKMRGL